MARKKTVLESLEGLDQNDSSKKDFEKNERIYRTIWEKSIAGLYIVQDGRFKSVNKNAASFAGYMPEDLIGKKSDAIVHPADRMMVKQSARNMLQGERTSPHAFRILTKKGEIRWIM
jgi:PAS domain S-box-containing protein